MYKYLGPSVDHYPRIAIVIVAILKLFNKYNIIILCEYVLYFTLNNS